MNSEILNFNPLFQYVESIPLIPKRNTKEFGQYRFLYQKMTDVVPNSPGLYLWIAPQCNRPVRYVGLSAQGLKQRFRNQFQQEYSVQWETIHGENPNILLVCQHYPKWVNKIQSQSLRGKAGTQFISYFECLNRTTKELHDIEAELIQYFDPVANEDRPKPTGKLFNEAIDIASDFEKSIFSYSKIRLTKGRIFK